MASDRRSTYSLRLVSEPFDLRVVSLARVVPHEQSEPRRVQRMVGRLQADDCLGNPPVVFQLDDRFMLVDGANRIAAMRTLGYRHTVVQVASPASVRLTTWHHVLTATTPERVLDTLDHIVELDLDEDRQRPAVCTVLLADGRQLAVHPKRGADPYAVLSPLVAGYLKDAVVRRVVDPDLAAHPDAAALVAFVELTIEDVFGAVRRGTLLPAGITRFVIPGRVLALNAPLAPLRSDEPAGALEAWLAELVSGRRTEGRIRHYPEAVFVLDD